MEKAAVLAVKQLKIKSVEALKNVFGLICNFIAMVTSSFLGIPRLGKILQDV